jgi:two-component system, chemotaxis family, protein-glutamate methylesterase/glutaminase
MTDDKHAEMIIQEDLAEQAQDRRDTELTLYSCPDCGGSLWQVDEGPLLRFRCHVGHVFGSEALLNMKSEEVEAALWQCVRLLTERATLTRQVMTRNHYDGNGSRLSRAQDQLTTDERHAEVIRELLTTLTAPTFVTSEPLGAESFESQMGSNEQTLPILRP